MRRPLVIAALLTLVTLACAACGGTVVKKVHVQPSKVTQVTWFIRGEIQVTSNIGYTPTLSKVACKAVGGNVDCFIEFTDNSCGTGVFYFKGTQIRGNVKHLHACAPVRPKS